MIRRANRNDIPELLDMLRQHHREKAIEWPFNERLLTATLSDAITAINSLLLIAERGMLLAFYVDCPMGTGRLAIERLIRSQMPGGFGALVEAYETWAREHGCIDASLSCTDRPAAFTRLYGRIGYEPAEWTYRKRLV